MHLRSKTVQQLLSVILSVVMVLSMLPTEVLAQETPPVTTPMDLTAITEDTSGDGWSWTQSTKTLTLTGLTLTVSDDSTHALILPDGATIDLADGTASTLTGGSRSTVYSSGEVKLRGSGSLTVYGRGWRSATLDMFIPGTLTVEYDDPDGGAVLKTDEGTEGAAICANVTLDNGILRATGPDFASADDGSSVGLQGRLTTHGSSVEAQFTARTGYASYGLYFDKQGSGRGDTWTMGLGKVTATAGHALSRYSYGLYMDYSSVNALELDGTQLTAMGGESDQYGSQGVFAGEEIIVKNGATVTATADRSTAPMRASASMPSAGSPCPERTPRCWATAVPPSRAIPRVSDAAAASLSPTATSSVRAACPAPAPEMWASSSSVSLWKAASWRASPAAPTRRTRPGAASLTPTAFTAPAPPRSPAVS